MSDDREQAWTAPPTDIAYANPIGPVLYAPAADADGLGGYLWVAQRVDARPRAGIVMLHPHLRADPSVIVQTDLGELALRLFADGEADAHDVMDYVATTRDGQGDKATVTEYRTATNLDAVRRLAGWQT